MTDNLVDTLLDVERAGWDSLCDSTGSEFYGAIMLAEAVMVLANGMVMDRRTVVDALSDSPPWRTYEISDVRCIPIDDDNAALVYTGTAFRDGTARVPGSDVERVLPHRRQLAARALSTDVDGRRAEHVIEHHRGGADGGGPVTVSRRAHPQRPGGLRSRIAVQRLP